MIKYLLPIHRLLFLLLLLLFFSMVWVYLSFIKAMYHTSTGVKNIEIGQIRRCATTIDGTLRMYLQPTDNLVEEIENNPDLRKKLNRVLELFVSREIKYVYVIYRDNKGFYRYLLDGSKSPKERGELNQIFIPVNTVLWRRCFESGKDTYAIQRNINTLWLTYLHPIYLNHKMQAVLVLDVSMIAYKKLKQTLAPLKGYLRYLLFFVLLVIFVTALELYLFMKERKLGRIDTLTHLYNRSYLREKERLINLDSVAVAMVDIDHFKRINDTYGHEFGDMVLKAIAKRLTTYTRTDDIVVRYGGEEFVIVFSNYHAKKNPEEVKKIISVAKRVQEQVSSTPVRVKDKQIKVTVSMGLDPFTYRRKTLLESILVADNMLYMAKRKGRDRVEVAKS